MKKVVLALAAITVVACFSMTSCSKKCTCRTPAGIIELNIDQLNEIIQENNGTVTIENCSDMKANVAYYTCE